MREGRMGPCRRTTIAALAVCVVTALFSLSPAAGQAARDEPHVFEPSRPAGGAAEPILIERRPVSEGASGRDVRRRVTFYPGGIREGCTPWRFEVQGRANGQIVFQVNEPDDQQIVLGRMGSDQYQDFLIGDDKCRYRIKIELSK
jgi:hypothetical protein